MLCAEPAPRSGCATWGRYRTVEPVQQFSPPPLLRNAHLMTIACAFWPRRYPALASVSPREFEVEPGTRILAECHWQSEPCRHPTLVLVHGLEGSSRSGYMLSAADKAFMMNAAKGGMMEVEWGKLAAQNGQNADVKKFGNRMVTDHSKANSELMALAKEEGVTLPGARSPGKWKSDKDYMDMMVKDHQADLAEFQKQAQSGTDPDLKAFAAKGAKMVSAHLKLAQETQGKLK